MVVKQKAARRLLNVLLVCMLVLGATPVALLFCLEALTSLGADFRALELPLGYLDEIFVDAHGRVYCMSSACDRLQIYDDTGHFRGGIWMKGHCISDLAEDKIHIVTTTNRHVIIDSTGREINRWRGRKGEYEEVIKQSRGNGCQDIHGNRYTTRNEFFLTEVVRTSPDGQSTVVVRELAYFWPIRMPIPAFIFFAVPLAVFIARDVSANKRARPQRAGSSE